MNLTELANLKQNKTESVKKDLSIKVNGRSADFILSNPAVGCQLHCSYCYIARNRPAGNPLHKYTNLDEIINQASLNPVGSFDNVFRNSNKQTRKLIQ